jgi:hypothetical protein
MEMFNILSYKRNANQNYPKTRCRWLAPVTLASQQAEIRGIAVQSGPEQTVP